MNARKNFGFAVLAIGMICLGLSGGIQKAQGSRYEEPFSTHLTPTVTRTPIRTPTPAPQPTSQSEQVFNTDEITYFSPGGGGEFCGIWDAIKDSLPSGASLPYVWADRVNFIAHIVCAYGFPPDRPVTIDLYTPDGAKAASFTSPARAGPYALIGREFLLDIPYGLPAGPWTVVARGGSQTAGDTFAHPIRGRATIDITHLLPSTVIHPYDPNWRRPFKQGDKAAFYAAGLESNQEVLVAVARADESDTAQRQLFTPVISWKARSNAGGFLHLQFSIDNRFQVGDYGVFLTQTTSLPVDDEDWIGAFFRVYSPWRACQAAPLSNIRTGDAARLTAGPPNNVRNRPRISARLLGKIQAYQWVIVTDGPRCNDGMTWWYVEAFDDTTGEVLEGWTAEGNASGYWLLPSR